MQKLNKKASILLWAIFLSIIISVAFIWVSTKVSKKLHNNLLFEKDVIVQNQIQNKLKQKDFTNQVFENWEKIYFNSSNSLQKNLKKDEKLVLSFSGWTSVDISIYKWWPITYSFISQDSWTQIWSWLVKDYDNINWNIESPDTTLELEIVNLWWYASLWINSTSDFTTWEKSYTITQTIWNKELIKTSWTIKID